MKATNNIPPKSFWTDSEPGLINATSHIFSLTPYFYCIFHIWQNIVKHLKVKLGENFHSFSKAFYTCRNALSIELFERKWKYMLDTFLECHSYMTKTMYPNHSNWAKSYLPFQFNGGVQSTQSVESFNAIIKKAVNSASTLCEVEKAIDKRYESKSQYCKLINPKAHQITVIESDITSNDFIENLVDELQATLRSLLSGIEFENIIETWRIRRIGGLSQRENLVVLLSDGTHLCTFAFSTAKTAINVALDTKTDGELIKILKDFIAVKYEKQSEGDDANNILDYTADQLLGQDVSNEIVPLQQYLIGQITNPNVTKIRRAPSKKRLKSAIKLSKKKVLIQENLNEPNNQIRSQRKCLLCGKSGYYQKKCPNAKKNDQYRGMKNRGVDD
ncbi:unnamed protein product [Rhizophagus irregularis]|nr:unnamed protein product [Rhizophagus irregularis]